MKYAAAAAALVLLGAACGESASSTSAPATAPPTTRTAPPPTPAPATAPPTTSTTTTTTTTPPPPSTTTSAAATTSTTERVDVGAVELVLEVVTVTEQPVFVDSPPGDPRLFVVDQPGRIWVVEDGVRPAAPFLDIRGLVTFRSEQGLLGLAFHPEYGDNGRFFVHYTDRRGDSRVVEYTVAAGDANAADRETARVLLTVDQPAGNHNGGMLAFGPDGFLYVGLGDGGGANDQYGQGQRPDTLLGAILRIDVDAAGGGGEPYAIPAGNPFAGRNGAPEVWHYGLRNPWRFSFDPGEGLLYIGDVGQNAWEEIDAVPAPSAGLNFGWPIMEGAHCFSPPANCDIEGLAFPVFEYGHGEGCSVTGGYVYRGAELPELDGLYFFGDFCAGWIRSLDLDGAGAEIREWPRLHVPGLTSFGTDAAGELYVTSVEGEVYRLVRG